MTALPPTHEGMSEDELLERKQKARVLGFAVLYLCLGALAVLVLFSILKTYQLVDLMRSTQTANTGIVRNTNETAEIIKDCTQPDGKCYKDGQRRTGQAVKDISVATTQASIYAAYCVKVDQTQEVASIERCVRRQFALANAKPHTTIGLPPKAPKG